MNQQYMYKKSKGGVAGSVTVKNKEKLSFYNGFSPENVLVV